MLKDLRRLSSKTNKWVLEAAHEDQATKAAWSVRHEVNIMEAFKMLTRIRGETGGDEINLPETLYYDSIAIVLYNGASQYARLISLSSFWSPEVAVCPLRGNVIRCAVTNRIAEVAGIPIGKNAVPAEGNCSTYECPVNAALKGRSVEWIDSSGTRGYIPVVVRTESRLNLRSILGKTCPQNRSLAEYMMDKLNGCNPKELFSEELEFSPFTQESDYERARGDTARFIKLLSRGIDSQATTTAHILTTPFRIVEEDQPIRKIDEDEDIYRNFRLPEYTDETKQEGMQ